MRSPAGVLLVETDHLVWNVMFLTVYFLLLAPNLVDDENFVEVLRWSSIPDFMNCTSSLNLALSNVSFCTVS